MTMKFVLLVTICVLGTVWCETHDQQMKFADRLILDIEDAVDGTNEMLKSYDETTEEARMLLSLHANAFNFNLHFILDCLQYVVIKNKAQSRSLQEIVFKLNEITYDLEDSFKHGVRMVKRQLQRSVENVMVEAKNMRRVIRECDDDHLYRANVLRYLDDLTTATQGAVSRNELRRQPKAAVKSLIRIARKILTSTLDSMNSSNPNVRKDIVRYSSEFSSVISETKNMLRDLVYSFKTKKTDKVKEIIYSLSKMVRDNDEVLHNEKSLQEIKRQFRVTIVDLTEQLNKLVDAGYSDDQTMEDENLIYVVLSGILNEGNSLQRNFEKTIDNYITPRSNE